MGKRHVVYALAFLLIYSHAFATTISTLPWSMTSEPDTRTSNGATVTYHATGGWDNGPRVVVTPPTSCPGGNGEYGGIDDLNFPDGNDIYIRYLLRWNVDLTDYANNCGYNRQIKMLITLPETRGMHITQDYCGLGTDYNFAPCYNTSCDWEVAGSSNVCASPQFDSDDYIGEWVYFEVHFDADGDEIRLWIATQDGTFAYTTAGNPRSVNNGGAITGPITSITGLPAYFNGSWDSGAEFQVTALTIDDEFIGPPEGFTSGKTITFSSGGHPIVYSPGASVITLDQ